MVDPSPDSCFPGFANSELPTGFDFYQGKVRDIFDLNDELLISTSDRISAFDQILGQVPHKGEVLNRLSAFWFKATEDLVANHLISVVSPRAMLVRKCHVVPVEVVVRGYLTGSAWRDYLAAGIVSGIELPDDMRFNQKFDTPILTPSTKEGDGLHDRPVSRDEVIYSGIVDPEVWQQIEDTALRVYGRGVEIAAQHGLILVDTKYEFGLLDGELVLIDELHTPDSSRYWFEDSYQELFDLGEKQRKLDKEYLRQWLMEQGFSGDGHPPVIPDDVYGEVSRRYQAAYEVITGKDFSPQSTDPEAEKQKLLSYVEDRQEEN